jgi:hypothetical protein
VGILSRLFGRRDPATDFASHLPVISQAVHDFQLGVYWRLSKRYESENLGKDAYSLAYWVVYDLFVDEEGKRSLHDFAEQNADLLAEEVRRAVCDKEINSAMSIAYAGQLMALGYAMRSPLSAEADRIVEKANSLGIEITNIVSLWGPKTIVNLHAVARDFRHANV